MMNEDIRKTAIETGLTLVKENLVQGTWGNISVRIDEEHMIVTPKGLAYELLTPEDLVVVNVNTLEYEGKNKPTTEKKIHSSIYATRPEIKAVIHTHSMWCSSLAAARIGIPAINDDIKNIVGGDVRVAKYGLPSTGGLTKNTLEALMDRQACLMAGHGVVACGKSIEEALEVCRIVEKAAKDFITSKVMEITGDKEVTIESFEKAFKEKTKK
ncbi:MAG TPA: class II aldolase/adducin family protein [Clostridia bacterium]|jgi:L-fuculose-phosphate aldolase|nr:class II aldolase/adducin family protein [Clostridia bacterium]